VGFVSVVPFPAPWRLDGFRKADDEEFVGEYHEMEKFRATEPEVEVEMPLCMHADMVEIFFNAGLVTVLEQSQNSKMAERMQMLDLTRLETFKTSDEAATWQAEMINAALLKITSAQAPSSDAALSAAIDKIKCFLSPLPRLPHRHMVFKLAPAIESEMLSLRAVFDTDSYSADSKAINDMLVTISQTAHDTYKVFSSPATGRRIINHLKTIAKEEVAKAAAFQRIANLCGNGVEESLDVLGTMDKELEGLKFKAPNNVLERYDEILINCMRSAGGILSSALTAIMAGKTDIGESPDELNTAASTFEALSKLAIHKQQQQHRTLPAVKLLLNCCLAPVYLLSPKQDKIQIADVDDLAPLLSSIGAFAAADPQDSVLQVCTAIGFDHKIFQEINRLGGALMAQHESERVAPNTLKLTTLVYEDKAFWEKAIAATSQDAAAVWITDEDVPRVVESAEARRAEIDTSSASLEDLRMMYSALGKKDMGLMLYMHWLLFLLRVCLL